MPKAKEKNSFVGTWFHSLTEEDKVRWQGQVTCMIEPGYYLVQTYEWMSWGESTQHIVTLEEMRRWLFYPTDEAMRDHYNYDLSKRPVK